MDWITILQLIPLIGILYSAIYIISFVFKKKNVVKI
jgi:hypothetical protein